MKVMRYIVLSTALFLGSPLLAANTNGLDAAQTAQIQQVVHDYLLNNPQIMLQMGQKLQQQQVAQAEQAQQQAKQTIPTLATELFRAPTSPVGGDISGTVTLVEFFDYQCSHCRDMSTVVDGLMQQNANLRVVYKEFPIFGASSDFAARAALAAARQGKYQAFHDALMQAPLPLTQKAVLDLAKSQGIDANKLQADMNSQAVSDELKQNEQLASKLKLLGTPAFIVSPTQVSSTADATLVPGATSGATLQQLISKAAS